MEHTSPFKIIVTVITIFIAVFSLLVFSGKLPFFQGGVSSGPLYSGKVLIWGTLPQTAMKEYLDSITTPAMGYTFEYQQMDTKGFNQSLVQALSYGSAPDIVIAPHDVILSNETYISALPYAEYSEVKYKSTYVDAGAVYLRPYGIVAFPLGIDPMVLFYNRDLQNNAGIVDTPKDWNTMLGIAEKYSKQSSVKGVFTTSILPFGAYKNYAYNKDMVMTLTNQLGGETIYKNNGSYTTGFDLPSSINGPTYIDSVTRFLAGFANPSLSSFTWSARMPNAFDSFVSGTLMYYPAYISDKASIESANSKLPFDYVFMPQVPDKSSLYTGARVLGIAMMSSSRNPVAAKSAYMALATDRTLANNIAAVAGMPSPRKDTLAGVGSSAYVEVIGKSILIAKPFYDINNEYSSSLVDTMFESIISNRSEISTAAEKFVKSIKKLYLISNY